LDGRGHIFHGAHDTLVHILHILNLINQFQIQHYSHILEKMPPPIVPP
jgi:hypothetical protein